MTEMGEQTRQHISRVPVVFYEQDPQWLWRMLRSARSLISFPGSLRQRIERYLECGTETASPALGLDCAMVKIDKVLGNRETQPEAAKLTSHGSISLLEWRK